MGRGLKKPSVRTYFVVKNDEGDLAYGIVEPNQEMISGLPDLELFTVEESCKTKLRELGVKEKEITENLIRRKPKGRS